MRIKQLILIIMLLFICGCQTLNDTDIDELVNHLSTDIKSVNIYRTGYSYYLPTGLSVREYSLYNEVLENEDIVFYLYVDIISYFNKAELNYAKKDNSFYSTSLRRDDKNGYLEINLQENNQYLIEIMFNYAKIEVMVDEDNINRALSYAVTILRSIEYNDEIINNLLSENILSYQEEIYNIFNTTSTDVSNYLKAVEQDQYEEETAIKDTDLIN